MIQDIDKKFEKRFRRVLDTDRTVTSANHRRETVAEDVQAYLKAGGMISCYDNDCELVAVKNSTSHNDPGVKVRKNPNEPVVTNRYYTFSRSLVSEIRSCQDGFRVYNYLTKKLSAPFHSSTKARKLARKILHDHICKGNRRGR